MNTLDIVRKVKCVKDFIGVYSRYTLPNIVSYPCCLIVNTDKSSDPGEHWIAIYFSKNKFAEYFDSFGLPPLHTSIVNFISLQSPLGFAYNNTTLQHTSSDTCGNYCIFFVHMRSKGYSICDILSIFSKNLQKNDSFVKHVTTKIACKPYVKTCKK